MDLVAWQGSCYWVASMVVELCGLQGGQGEGGGLGVVDGERGLLEAGCLQWQRGAVKGNITCMARLSEQIGQR